MIVAEGVVVAELEGVEDVSPNAARSSEAPSAIRRVAKLGNLIDRCKLIRNVRSNRDVPITSRKSL